MSVAVAAVALAAAGAAAVRWLRVAQREHYLPGAAARFAWRWWAGQPLNAVLAAVALAATLAAWVSEPAVGLAAAVIVATGPLGLGVRGRTSKLAWTRRLRTLAAIAAALVAIAVALAAATGAVAPVAVTVAVLVPVVVDLALLVAVPVERNLARRYVTNASSRLYDIAPVVVAITGSYGKTTTKGYVRHLVSGSRRVVASPASFNNRAGLSRAVNENLTPGTEVFVAEMGTYGPGEIRELCTWVRPHISVITAIGPVHLERMGSIENIVTAKSEILEAAEIAVLNVDAPYLGEVADRFAERGRVLRCSTLDRDADVFACREGDDLVVAVGGERLAAITGVDAHPGNVACAVGVALALDVPREAIAERLSGLPTAPNRLNVSTSPKGVVVIDDTFNANPAGAAAALEALNRQGGQGRRRVVVTPGMVELGPMQFGENAALATAASRAATDVVVVGRTNRKALLEGARLGPATVHVVDTRDDAVAWVRTQLGPRDVVLYENDLPDHYP